MAHRTSSSMTSRLPGTSIVPRVQPQPVPTPAQACVIVVNGLTEGIACLMHRPFLHEATKGYTPTPSPSVPPRRVYHRGFVRRHYEAIRVRRSPSDVNPASIVHCHTLPHTATAGHRLASSTIEDQRRQASDVSVQSLRPQPSTSSFDKLQTLLRPSRISPGRTIRSLLFE